MDLGDRLVYEELLDLRDLWDLKEMGVTLARLVLLVRREKLECQAYQENLEKLVRTETLDPRDQQEGQAREVCLACRVFQDLKATEDFPDWMEPRETLGPLEKKERMALLARWEQLALLDLLDPEEKEEGMDRLECLDLEDWMEPLDLLVTWELWESLVVLVSLVFRGQKETLVVMALREVQECKVQEENQESLECQENLVSWDHQEKMEVMERKEGLVCQELLALQDSLDREDNQVLMVAQGPMDQRE